MGKVKKSKLQKSSQVTNRLDNSSSSDDDNDNFDRASADDNDIDVEFEAYGICEKDLDGIVQLFKQAYLNVELDVDDMANILVNQDGRGCIFMTAIDDENEAAVSGQNPIDDIDNEIYGVVSYVDILEHQDKKCVEQIRKLVRDAAYNSTNNEVTRTKIDKFLNDLETGQPAAFLINERLINLPYHIALPAFQALSKELDQSGVNYGHFVLISKISRLSSTSENKPTTANSSKRTSNKRRRETEPSTSSDQQNILFANAEEEFLSEECSIQLDFKVPHPTTLSKHVEQSTFRTDRRILIFDRVIFNRFLQKFNADIKSHCD